MKLRVWFIAYDDFINASGTSTVSDIHAMYGSVIVKEWHRIDDACKPDVIYIQHVHNLIAPQLTLAMKQLSYICYSSNLFANRTYCDYIYYTSAIGAYDTNAEFISWNNTHVSVGQQIVVPANSQPALVIMGCYWPESGSERVTVQKWITSKTLQLHQRYKNILVCGNTHAYSYRTESSLPDDTWTDIAFEYSALNDLNTVDSTTNTHANTTGRPDRLYLNSDKWHPVWCKRTSVGESTYPLSHYGLLCELESR